VVARILIAASTMAVVGGAQSLTDQVNFKSVTEGGLRLYGVSAFTGYSTTAFPLSLGQAVPTEQAPVLAGSFTERRRTLPYCIQPPTRGWLATRI